MYARVTTVEGQADRLDEGIRTFQEQTVPFLQGQAGFQNAYLLVDRQRGRALAVSLWESSGAMQQTEETIAQQRQQVAQQMGASTPTVERYEVPVSQGSAPAQAARVTSGSGSPERMDDTVRLYQEQQVPGMRQQPGFAGALLLMDRQSGKGISLTLWDSMEAAQAFERVSEGMRAQATQTMQIQQPPTVDLYEVAVQV
jgi:heme-degrading monooxygenase HmoA